ncbi:reverse transcriptase domain-containing protein [Tanacetum coccineum]
MGSMLMANGEECLDGWVRAGGGEVKGGGVDFGVILLGEIPGESTGKIGGEEFGVEGGPFGSRWVVIGDDKDGISDEDNKKELWDSRMHQTGKETGGEGMPKVLGLQGLKQWKGGHQPLTTIGENLPSNSTLLSHHAQPFIPSSLHIPTGLIPVHVNPYSQPSAILVHGQAPNLPFQTQIGNPPAGGTFIYHHQRRFRNPFCSLDQGLSSSRRTKNAFLYWFLRWEGDPDNFLHLFEGAIRMQKWLMPVACHTFTYTLKDSARIWWNSQKMGSILSYDDLKAKFRSHFSQQNKFIKTHLAVHYVKQRECESIRAFITRYTDDTLQILGLHEEQRISDFVHGLRTRSLVKHLSTDLPSTYKGLMDKAYTWVEARGSH